jgi:hypothetical protein
MDNTAREHGRYGKGKSKGKGHSWKSTKHEDWTKEHASDYLNSDEAKDHQAMQAHAQQLMAQPDPAAQGAPPGAAGPAAAPAPSAMAPAGGQ